MTQKKKSKYEIMQEEQFEKRFSSKWSEVLFMLPSLMVLGFMLWLGTTPDVPVLIIVVGPLTLIQIILTAFRKKILLQEEKINKLQEQINSQEDIT